MIICDTVRYRRRSAISKGVSTPVVHFLWSKPVDEFVNMEHFPLVFFHTVKSKQAKIYHFKPKFVWYLPETICCQGSHAAVLVHTINLPKQISLKGKWTRVRFNSTKNARDSSAQSILPSHPWSINPWFKFCSQLGIAIQLFIQVLSVQSEGLVQSAVTSYLGCQQDRKCSRQVLLVSWSIGGPAGRMQQVPCSL